MRKRKRMRRGGSKGWRYVSVFPHWRYIRCKIGRVTTWAQCAITDIPCKVRLNVSAVQDHVIDSTIDGTLCSGAIPVVVLFAVGPHMQIRRISMPSVRFLLIHAISPEPGDDTSFFPFKFTLKICAWLCFLPFPSNLFLSAGVDRARAASYKSRSFVLIGL